MAYPFLPLTLALMAFSVGAEPGPTFSIELEPCTIGEVSASGLFPNQEMEDELQSNLCWTKEQRLSPLVAFESVIDRAADAGRLLPSRSMAEQFGAYLRWVEEEGLSPFYTFTAFAAD